MNNIFKIVVEEKSDGSFSVNFPDGKENFDNLVDSMTRAGEIISDVIFPENVLLRVEITPSTFD
jgi:hypothetical protein